VRHNTFVVFREFEWRHVLSATSPVLLLLVQSPESIVEGVSRANVDIFDVKAALFGNMHDHRLAIPHIVEVMSVSHLTVCPTSVWHHLNFIVLCFLGGVHILAIRSAICCVVRVLDMR
jgi:hypothetical protein